MGTLRKNGLKYIFKGNVHWFFNPIMCPQNDHTHFENLALNAVRYVTRNKAFCGC